MKRNNHWINGQSVKPANLEYLPTLNPFTTEPWAEIARGDEEDVDKAVTSASEAFHDWKCTSASQRADILWKLGDQIAEHANELADLESIDAGKVIREVRGQHLGLRSWYRYYASLAYQQEGRQIPHDRYSITATTIREPYGVIAVIPAFNSPLLLGTMALAPALAAGNTVVIKPPEVNALSLLLLGNLAKNAGLPDGCLNIVNGYGHEAGDALVAHPLVRKVFFTGGVESARKVAVRASDGLKPTVLELGGKSANIFFDDVEVEKVANGVIAGIFAAAGQTCIAGSRLLVHENIADRLVAAVSTRTKAIRIGDPTNEATEMGPLSQEKILAGVQSRVTDAITQGAQLVTGGPNQEVPSPGWFYAPTVLDNVNNEMAVAQEELFGPVLSVIRFSEEEEAVQIANDSQFGLAAGIWTSNISRAHRMTKNLDAGTIWINTYRALNYAIPFGGIKSSGYGRVNGLDGFSEFTQPKSIWIESSEEPVADPFVLR